ncbi:MAG: hypothetical protein OXE78_00315 [Gammaproteobacteria bacterium]|nr:hypothetical protein [Gammaproteobacteria bacterium]
MQSIQSFQEDVHFSWHLAEYLVYQEFDIATCQEMLVDHGFVPMWLIWWHLPT